MFIASSPWEQFAVFSIVVVLEFCYVSSSPGSAACAPESSFRRCLDIKSSSLDKRTKRLEICLRARLDSQFRVIQNRLRIVAVYTFSSERETDTKMIIIQIGIRFRRGFQVSALFIGAVERGSNLGPLQCFSFSSFVFITSTNSCPTNDESLHARWSLLCNFRSI